MAGRITVSTLNNDTGVLATQNGMTGIPKAWVNFNGTGTVAIRGSFNVSSITDNGTGDYTVNFTTVLPNANYSFNLNSTRSTLGTANDAISFLGATPTAAALRISTTAGTGTLVDSLYTTVSVFSS
jgi:hypothetical protein